ncbi:uncharacterized protein LOC119280483 [Triticum dicoccoides]|uniref:uncharacterized protein LOC119280483 n=1 Tax=Triticum dicoccoides TaxID=85692 RepID=UPI000E7CCECD|nr:uncharacterized protein LOC119280483 [Triticum dicoccoides]
MDTYSNLPIGSSGRDKNNVHYRCSLHQLPPFMKCLSDMQIGFVRKIGFESILSMQDFKMDKDLTLWLVDKFNCDTEELEFDEGISIPVRPLVKFVLGIPSGPIKVIEGLHVDDALYEQYTWDTRGKKAKEVAEEMCSITEEEPFCIAFVMAILAIYLAPNTSVSVSRSFLGAARQVGNLKQMDWCNLVADCLFKGIKDYKQSDRLCVHVKGCVHILSVIFIDLAKHPTLIVPDGFPRLSVVTTEMGCFTSKWVVAHPFGSFVPVRCLEESVYAPVLNNMPNGNTVEGVKCSDSDSNTDALADQVAITDTDQNNNKHPILAELGNARTTHNTSSSPIVEHVVLDTPARASVAAPSSLTEHIIFPTSGEQLQSAGPSDEPHSAQIMDSVQVPPDTTVERRRGLLLTMEKDDRSTKKARVELSGSGQVKQAEEVTIKMDMSLLNCSVCSRPIKPPVFECNAGHLACYKCLIGLPYKLCQTCEHSSGFGHIRSLDAIVSSLTVKCHHDGCGSYVPYYELDDHQSVCPHVPCFCTELGCGFVGAPQALLGHLIALHAMPVHKVHYGQVHQLRLSVTRPRCLLHGQGDDSVFLLVMGVFGVVSVVCIRAEASSWPQYAVKLQANGPPPPSSVEGSILLAMKPVTSSTRPGEVAVEELPSFLMVPPTYLVGSGASKEVSLDVRIDKM